MDLICKLGHICSHSMTCTHSVFCRRPSSLVAFHICYLLNRASVHEITALVISFQCMSDIFIHYGDIDPLYIFIMDILIYHILYVVMTTHVTFCISCLFMTSNQMMDYYVRPRNLYLHSRTCTRSGLCR